MWGHGSLLHGNKTLFITASFLCLSSWDSRRVSLHGALIPPIEALELGIYFSSLFILPFGNWAMCWGGLLLVSQRRLRWLPGCCHELAVTSQDGIYETRG